jgi:hypothetical protein
VSFVIGDHQFRFMLASHEASTRLREAGSESNSQGRSAGKSDRRNTHRDGSSDRRGKKKQKPKEAGTGIEKHSVVTNAQTPAASDTGVATQLAVPEKSKDDIRSSASDRPAVPGLAVQHFEAEAQSLITVESNVSAVVVDQKHREKSVGYRWLAGIAAVLAVVGALAIFRGLPQSNRSLATDFPVGSEIPIRTISAGPTTPTSQPEPERPPLLTVPTLMPDSPQSGTKNAGPAVLGVGASSDVVKPPAGKETHLPSHPVDESRSRSSIEKEGEIVLLRRDPGRPDDMHVLSPDLSHVLHVSVRKEVPNAVSDLMFDGKRVFEGIRVATQADLRFSADGSRWMAHGLLADGTRMILLPDRSFKVEGDLQMLFGNKDFSVVSYVTRLGDEDHLHVNGKVVSSYLHIVRPRVSEDGRRWAYVAVKDPGSAFSSAPAGERVVTDAWKSPVADRVGELQLSHDGSRLAYVAYRPSGGESLFLDGKLVHDVAPGDGSSISLPTFAPEGRRFAWMLTLKGGVLEFRAEDLPSVIVEPTGPAVESTLLSRNSIMGRIVFTQDGGHVAFAATGKGGVVYLDGARVGEYPAVQLESIAVSPDGSRVAVVTLHPLGEAAVGGGGLRSQPHGAVLRLNGRPIQTVGLKVHRKSDAFPVTVGGFYQVAFSSDSRNLAAKALGAAGGEGRLPKPELFVNGKRAYPDGGLVHAFFWLPSGKIRVALQNPSGLAVRECEWAP